MRYLVIVALYALIVGGCQSKTHVKPPVGVIAYIVEPQTIPIDFSFVGVAKSSHPVEIRARVEGYLNSIDYVEGSMVDKDALLFQLDPRPFIASLNSAQGALARQEAVLWRNKKSLERIEPLFKQNAASKRDLDDATAAVLAAEASVIEAKANVVQAELNLSYTYITSPIKGLTGRALFREGTLITPSVNGLLTYVSVIDPIWIYFSISDNELLQGKAEGAAQQLILPENKDYSVTLKLSDDSTFPCTGKVNFTSPQLDPQTGTLSVRAEFPNPQGGVLPGQFVNAIVSGAYRPDALLVPQTSVFQGNKGKYLYVINSDNTLTMREVLVSQWYKEYWIIQSGLNGGETVVAEGINKVQNGSQIQIISTTSFQDKKKQELD